jgi:sugar phosphate isomerase/epimerase
VRFAYSTNAYTEHDLPFALRDIAAAGFDGVEILCDVPHAVPGRMTDAQAAEIGRILAGEGLAVSNLNVNTSCALEGSGPGGFLPPLDHPAKRDYVLGAIELAERWGAANIAICPVDSSDAALRALLERSGRVRVGIEYEPGLTYGDAASVRGAIDRLGHPNLGANLDIGHTVVAGERIPQTVRLLAGRIWNVHVEDIAGRVHDHLIPGLGDIDYREAVAALGAAGYTGFLTLELYPYKKNPGEAGRRGLAHLREVLA